MTTAIGLLSAPGIPLHPAPCGDDSGRRNYGGGGIVVVQEGQILVDVVGLQRSDYLDCHEDIVGLVRGPYYSWFAREKEDGTGAMGRSVVEAVRDVLRVVTYCGPFDGCYAFSSGAAVAALASGIAKDPSLMEAVRDLEDASKGDGVASRLYGRVKGTSPAVFAHRLKNAVGRRNSVRSVALLNEEAGSLEGGDLGKFCYASD